MPGNQVIDWKRYHALRAQGYSKEAAAKITNSKKRRKPKSRKDKLRAASKRSRMGG